MTTINQNPRMFAQITKVDAAKREVWGRLVQEVPDRSGEIFDYESSKPYFKAWSDEFAEATGGASLGNLRAMHGKTAAGKFIAMDFNDAEKAIDVGAKVVDDAEWKKCEEGVYTGFSIGGSYVGDKVAEKVNGTDVLRYTAKPVEGSLVDSPCVPTAKFFDMVKADGVIEKVAFQTVEPPAAAEAEAEPIPLEVTGTDAEVAEFAKALNDSGLTMADAIAAVKAAKPAEPAPPAEGAGVVTGGKSGAGVATGESAGAGVAKGETAGAGVIETGATDADINKGMWNVQDFASCLSCIASVAAAAEADMQWEGDGSKVPQKLRDWLASGIAIFKAMAAEESAELLAGLKEMAGEGAEVAIALAHVASGRRALSKRLADPALTISDALALSKEYEEPIGDGFADRVLAKAGARHSKEDAAHLQTAHDALTKLGAACSGKTAAAEPDTLAKGAAELAKISDELKETKARLEKLESQPVPARTIALAGIKTIAKSADVATQAAEGDMSQHYVYKTDGTIDQAATVIKFTQSLGGRHINAQTLGQS